MVIKGPGFTNGTIILKEPGAVYYSGQLLSGSLHFEINETLHYLAINLAYLGEAIVELDEMRYEMSGGDNRYREVKHTSREQYINFVQCVSSGAGISSLRPGVHSIPFQFQVPFNAPSSFKGEKGMILYCITAYLEYPEPKKREQLGKEFQVVAPISPNTLANVTRPLELNFEEIVACNCFCTSNSINMKIALPSGALHVGSSVPIHVHVENDSSVEIYDICFKITKRHTYRTQRPRSEYSAPEETVVEMKKGPILSDTRREYTWDLQLPVVVLPNLESCSIIDVVYLFKVKIQLTGCNEPVEDESEIFIGVLPDADTSTVTSSNLESLLPKDPIPNPNLPVGLIPTGQNYSANAQIPPPYDHQMRSTTPDRAQKYPLEIGFVTPIPTHRPYPASNISRDNPPYPTVPPPMANPPYPTDVPPYLYNSQPNNSAYPSAPPL